MKSPLLIFISLAISCPKLKVSVFLQEPQVKGGKVRLSSIFLPGKRDQFEVSSLTST